MDHWQVTMRDTLVVLLTLTTGAVDAASFLALGKAFSSVITGNLVLLGLAAGTGGGTLAVHSGVALAGFSAGVLVGAPIAARHSGTRTWPRSVTITLAAEMLVLAAFTVGWEVSAGRPGPGAQLALLALLAAAMGMQSAAVRQLGQMSSTYLTSTLAGVLAAFATRTKQEGLARSVGVLAAIVAGAAAAAVLVKMAPSWVPVAVLVPAGAVVVLAAAGFGRAGERLAAGRGR